MEYLHLLLHLDQTLVSMADAMGSGLYVVLFLVVFAETGLVVTPFLPGDSLLFALGALTALGNQHFSFELFSLVLFVAALAGDNVNYFFGKTMGPKIFRSRDSKLLNVQHLERAQAFYHRHGVRAVILARFIPIVRTFVPFVAGLAKMQYQRFLSFSVLGALLWIQLFMWAGRLFGNMPQVQSHFHWVILAVIVISLAPLFANIARNRYLSRNSH